MNGDGFADVALTAGNDSYVVFGKATGFVANLDLSTLGAGEGFNVVGASNASASAEVASAGDVNGDGFDDLFIKSESQSKNYVVFGAATGLGTSINVTTLNGTNGFSITGVTLGIDDNHIGSAGDFNGDGFADVIFSNNAVSGDGGVGSGDAYVIFGQASGFAAAIDISSLTGSSGFRLEGFFRSIYSTPKTGSSVSSAGDVNGDGFDDMIVGAINGTGSGEASKAYIVFGKASGFASALVLPNLDGTNGFALEGLSRGTGEAPEGYVPKLFGHGRLAFTVDQGRHTERYQGIVPLEGGTLADCAHTYFRQSEQLPTGIKIAAERVERDGTAHWRAAALMVQQMPEFDAGRIDVDHEQREDDWRKAVILMASATDAEMLDPKLPGVTLLHRLFHAEQPRLFTRRSFGARCRCSRDRIDRVLRSIKRQELDDLRDASGRVAVKCEFCSTEYAYDDHDLDRIYASAA